MSQKHKASSTPVRVRVNLNNDVYVTLTDEGRAYVLEQLRRLYSVDPDSARVELHAHEGVKMYDRGRMQLHEFAAMFGPALGGAYHVGNMFVNGLTVEIDAEVQNALMPTSPDNDPPSRPV